MVPRLKGRFVKRGVFQRINNLKQGRETQKNKKKNIATNNKETVKEHKGTVKEHKGSVKELKETIVYPVIDHVAAVSCVEALSFESSIDDDCGDKICTSSSELDSKTLPTDCNTRNNYQFEHCEQEKGEEVLVIIPYKDLLSKEMNVMEERKSCFIEEDSSKLLDNLSLEWQSKVIGYMSTSSQLPDDGVTIKSRVDQVGVAEQSGDMICDYCQSTVEKNRFGQREELLICKDCGNKAHPSCLSYSPELVQQIRADDSWQCIDCKACVLCNGTGDPDTLLFCDACDKGYHMHCHSPKLDKMPSGKWACASCLAKGKTVMTPVGNKQPVFIIEDDEKEIVTPVPEPKKPTRSTPSQKADQHVIANVPPVVQPPRPVISVAQPGIIYHPSPHGMPYGQIPTVTTPVTVPPGHPVPVQLPVNQPHLIPVNYVVPNGAAVPPQPPNHVLGKGVQNDMTHILNPKMPLPDVRSTIREDVLRALAPDVADWNVRDVSYYFKSHGYLQESKLLEEQEIDGRAMLLMSRNDCLTGLRIKLGPALKIYHMHIHKLQKRTDFLG